MRFRWRRLTYFSTKFLGGRLPSWCTLGKKIVLGGDVYACRTQHWGLSRPPPNPVPIVNGEGGPLLPNSQTYTRAR
jgi:hypothetical protein